MGENEVEAVILTKSSKNGGYCVAGIRTDTGDLVRFVSDDQQSVGALTDSDMEYQDGTVCKPLDLVRIPVLCPVPSPRQPENLLIDGRRYWEKAGEWTLPQILRLHPVERWRQVFGTYGYNLSEEEHPGYSLGLILVTNLVIQQENKTKASFFYHGSRYQYMSVTDPDYYNTPDGTQIGNACLIVSLPENTYNEKYYKFIAKIFPVRRA